MTEKEVGFKRQLDAVGKAVSVYVPPAKRRQLRLEKEELERRKHEDEKQKESVVRVEDGEPEGKTDPSSSAIPKDDAAAATTTGNPQTEQQEQLQLLSKQRETWQDQRRVINGTVNRLNSATIKPLIQELFQKVNLVRLRGPLCKSVLSAAVSSPKYSDVYAAIVAVINSKLPEVGELMVKRAILAFRRYYKQRDKASCQAVCVYIVHLFHQGVVHELIVLQLLSVLLDGARPTDDSVEIAVHVLQIAGQALLDCSSAGVRACTERMRSLLHEGHLNQRVEYRVEELLKARKNGFKDFPSISEELDLVERDDQITFDTSLDDNDIQKEEELDVFSFDPELQEHEEEWNAIRAEILGLGDSSDDSSDDSDSDDDSDSSDDESEEEASASGENALAAVTEAGNKQIAVVEDLTEADLVHLRRTIYLTIMSSATFEECAHKLARINVPPGRESELINMLIECCSQERTFLRYYGLIASRFCLMDHRWKDAFMESFSEQYTTIHRLETNKLRNVAKLFSHLLHTDSMPWSVMSIIHLNEDETTSSSRIFIKIVIQEMAEAMGIAKLNKRFETEDEEQKLWYAGMFPKDNVRNTRYAINFFTSIGLGPLTDDLREFLKNAPKLILAKAKEAALAKKDEDSGDESSSVSSTSSSSSSFSSSSSSTSSYSSYTSSSSYSSSSSGSYSRGRRRGRALKRTRRSNNRRRHSSDSFVSSQSSQDSRSRSRGRNDDNRRSKTRGRSRSPPKIITKEKSRGDRSRSSNRSRSPSSSLSKSRRKGDGRQGSRDRSRSPPKVISSRQDRGNRRFDNRSQGSVSSRSSGRSPRRGREKNISRSPSKSPRRPSGRSPSRERDNKKSTNSDSRSPRRSSSPSPPRGKDTRRSPRGRRKGSSRSASISPRRPSSRSPPRGRSKENRSRSRSQSRSTSRGESRRRRDFSKHSRSRRRYRSNSSSRSSSVASYSSGSHSRGRRRHQSGKKNNRRPRSSSRSP
mmetsp:Transcript_1508/g.3500  ORF Transcript_1508/g.3500 Transcript_1508/m.3500 type:complete len:982 (-) Transcript_1508:365-3310(-)